METKKLFDLVDLFYKKASLYCLGISEEELQKRTEETNAKMESIQNGKVWEGIPKYIQDKYEPFFEESLSTFPSPEAKPPRTPERELLNQYINEYKKELKTDPNIRKRLSDRENEQRWALLKAGGMTALLLKLRIQVAGRKKDFKSGKKSNEVLKNQFLKIEPYLYKYRDDCRKLILKGPNPNIDISGIRELGNQLQIRSKIISPTVAKTIYDINKEIDKLFDTVHPY